jgi:hypothetical protein
MFYPFFTYSNSVTLKDPRDILISVSTKMINVIIAGNVVWYQKYTTDYHVYSRIVEIIKKHPSVKDCIVVAIKHKIKSEVPKAVIVLKDDIDK